MERAGWQPGIGSTGQGIGVAISFANDTYVAEVAQVSVDEATGQDTGSSPGQGIDCLAPFTDGTIWQRFRFVLAFFVALRPWKRGNRA